MQSKGVPALAIEDLSASFFTYRGEVVALADVELELKQGEMLGIVGATGSGKSVLARGGYEPGPGAGTHHEGLNPPPGARSYSSSRTTSGARRGAAASL